MLKKIFSNVLFILDYFKFNLASSMEYRFNFYVQIVSMIINDAIYLLIWYVFFLRFENLGGWNFHNMLMIWSIATVGFGLCMMFFRNIEDVSREIVEGKMDFYLTFPKNPMIHIVSTRTSPSAIGDFIFGILLYITSTYSDFSILNFILFIFVSSLGGFVFFSFLLLVESMSFFIGYSKNFSKTMLNAIIMISSNPGSVYDGLVKFIVFFIIPAGFFTFIPQKIVFDFNIYDFFGLIVFAICIFILASFVFSKGLKKYESGNMINSRS